MAQRFACSKSPTKKASPASCRAITAMLWNCKSAHMVCVISRTTLWNGKLLISNSVPDWYFLISLRAFSPLIFFTSCSSFHSLLLSVLFLPSLLLFSSFFSIFFPIFSLTALAHLAFYFLIFSLAALIRVIFVLQAISTNKNRFYMLHFTTYIPTLQLVIINKFIKVEQKWNIEINTCTKIKQTEQFMENTYCWTRCLFISWGIVSCNLSHVTFPMESFPFPFPLTPKNLIPLGVFSYSLSFMDSFCLSLSIILSFLFLLDCCRINNQMLQPSMHDL